MHARTRSSRRDRQSPARPAPSPHRASACAAAASSQHAAPQKMQKVSMRPFHDHRQAAREASRFEARRVRLHACLLHSNPAPPQIPRPPHACMTERGGVRTMLSSSRARSAGATRSQHSPRAPSTHRALSAGPRALSGRTRRLARLGHAQEVGVDARGGDGGTRARALHDQRLRRVALGRECADVVGELGAGEGVGLSILT